MVSQPDSSGPVRQVIDEAGEVTGALPGFATDPESLVPLYRAMVKTRVFDEKAIGLQRTGRLGTYASSLGQEAVSVGAAAAMHPDDVLLPSFREQGAMLWRGVRMEEILLFWGGDERGSAFGGAGSDFPVCIPVGTHYPHAAGAAFALKYHGRHAAALAIAGDGSTSRGDFYEAMNIGGAWQLPVVFLVCNNQWAISVPRDAQTAAETLAQKSVAAGIPGVRVDGNDVIAVKQVVAEALHRAREQHVATLVEAVSYRLGDHTTADDATRYRSDEEVSAHWQCEPLRRMRGYLEKTGVWDVEREEALLRDVGAEVETAINAYLETPADAVSSMFEHLFESLPRPLQAQRDMMRNREADDA